MPTPDLSPSLLNNGAAGSRGLPTNSASGIVVLSGQIASVSTSTSLGEYTLPDKYFWHGMCKLY